MLAPKRVAVAERIGEVPDLAAQGFDVSGLTGPAFRDSIEEQFERWAKIVRATGFSAE